MKVAIVPQVGRAPVYGDFKEPVPLARESLIVVIAAGARVGCYAVGIGQNELKKRGRLPLK